MRYMLDTNMCIYLIKRKPAGVRERFSSKRRSDVCLSAIAVGELEYGVERSARKAENRAALVEFLSPIQIVPFDAQAARLYGEIRAALEATGQPIVPFDTQIAAHALSLDCTLVTNDAREFARVPGLTIENWTL